MMESIPMRIALIDPCGWDYHAGSTDEMPLGGSQSALCHLAAELACAGCEVHLWNGCRAPRNVRGVYCAPLASVSPQALGSVDAAVLLNAVKPALQIKPHLGPHAPLILWTQHAHDQPAVQPLANPAVVAALDAIAFVSRWQRQQYERRFALAEIPAAVMRNAVAPAFERAFTSGQAALAARGWPPLLAYTSTPFRGLDRLLAAFPLIRHEIPGTRLLVFSSMQVYQVGPARDAAEYGHLYQAARSCEGVEYVGSLAQPALATRLKQVLMLAYPNTFAETSCIAVLEALAAGCLVVTSDLGALPESCHGLARLTAPLPDPTEHAAAFARAVVEELAVVKKQPWVLCERLDAQLRWMNARYTWSQRAAEWLAWLKELIRSKQLKRLPHGSAS
jgi:glycosyltransferase involved in cell wall biosynthesis